MPGLYICDGDKLMVLGSRVLRISGAKWNEMVGRLSKLYNDALLELYFSSSIFVIK
jgi:hypothetical protein